MRRIVFTQSARAELIEAQDWYEAEAPGLGRRFRADIDALVGRIAANPLQFPLIFKTVRRGRVRKFPYSLFFVLAGDAVIVIACFHGSRDPKRWLDRA